uniref:Utp8 beta-propeller domain-containing protein n=1 Tax=Mycena chlorophos TaxID=658473 RepID=A0ABQ0LRN4_MYCCL|nr:predicted protein [Mycena chlorophos]
MSHIAEPIHVASYPISRPRKSPKRQNIFATHEKVASEGYITTTVQGDGVHVLDLATLHPVISHTLGPSTSFSCPSVSVADSQKNVCTTYSVVASSADVELDACGRTIWVWREDTSSTDRSSQKKKAAVVIPHTVTDLYACTSQNILLASPDGDWTLVDSDLKVRSTIPATTSSSATVKSFVFASTFLPTYSGNTTVVSLEKTADSSINLRLLVLLDSELVEVGRCTLPIQADQIRTASCSPSGFLTVLSRSGSWSSFQIEATSDGITVFEAAQAISLTGLTFIGGDDNEEISLVAINTSLVLLVGVALSPRRVVLLLWDLQYAVLLASHTFSIPSALSSLPQISITASVTQSSSPQALLLLSAASGDSAPPKSARSSIFAVPITCPNSSTLGSAMGRAAAGAQWLTLLASEETSRTKVLRSVQQALAKKDAAAAEAAFFAWEANEREADSGFGHSFVGDLLNSVLQANGAYASRIIKLLLEKRVVSASMVDGGLLAALKLHDDWNAIALCTETVLDISESDLVYILRVVIENSRASATAMDVDAPLGKMPSLAAYLNACVRYRTSSTALRVAIHQHLNQAEDILAVLDILDQWIIHWRTAQVVVIPPKRSVHKDAFGASVLADSWPPQPQDAARPPLPRILAFLHPLLDASFLTLLQHSPAHVTLRRISEHIEPEIRLTEQVDALRGSLEIFALAQAKAVRDAKEEKQNAKEGSSKRKKMHERNAMAVGGLYQLEELVL